MNSVLKQLSLLLALSIFTMNKTEDRRHTFSRSTKGCYYRYCSRKRIHERHEARYPRHHPHIPREHFHPEPERYEKMHSANEPEYNMEVTF